MKILQNVLVQNTDFCYEEDTAVGTFRTVFLSPYTVREACKKQLSS